MYNSLEIIGRHPRACEKIELCESPRTPQTKAIETPAINPAAPPISDTSVNMG